MDPVERLTAHRDQLRELMAEDRAAGRIAELERFRVGLFAERDTVAQALEYAYSMNDPAVTTAVHVLLNTVIKQLTANSETGV